MLVAILAGHSGRISTVERLIDGLWDGHPPVGARNRVQALVASLRKLAGRDLITTRPPGYLLGPAVGVDSLDFADEVRLARGHAADANARLAVDLLNRALARWRDDAFVDVSSSLVEFERDRLHELREHALEERFEAQLSLGLHRELVPELVKSVNDRPLRQRLRGQLMIALRRSGREAEALAVYRTGAQLLADEHGLDPTHHLRRLHGEILADDRPPAHTAKRVRPQQLPAVIADFVGRDKELGHLRSLLSHTPEMAGAAQIIVMMGLPGAGKTTLALRAAHEHRHKFPDGCLFADLRGNTTHPADPSAVLAAFLRALGVTSQAIPSDLDERAALYRSVLADQRALIVLDSAADAAQVKPLLPPGPNSTLITTTAGLSGLPGIIALPLDVLPLADGLDLLASLAGADRVGRETEAAAQVVELCGGLPLALRIAGVRLAERETMTITRLRDRLQGERRRLDELSLGELDVRSSFTVGFERLPPAAAKLLGLLSRTSLRNFSTLDPDDDHLLEQLCRAQMLTAHSDGRVRMHDLVRLHARERAEADEEALVHWYEHLLRQAVLANASLPCQSFPGIPAEKSAMAAHAALTWFEDERENLAAAAADLLALGQPDLAGRLVYTMGNFALMREGHMTEWAENLESVLGESDGLTTHTRLSLQLGLAVAWRLTGRIAEAMPLLRTVYRDSRGRLPEHQIAAASSYALCSRRLGRVRLAEAALRIALGLCATHRPADPIAGYCLLVTGEHYGQYQRHSEFSHSVFEAANELFQRCGDSWGRALVHESVGVLHKQAGNWQLAAVHLGQAIAVHRGLGDKLTMTIAEQALAAVHLAAGDTDAARALLRRIAPAFRDMRYAWGQGVTQRLLGSLLLSDGEPAKAVVELESSVAVLRSCEQPFTLARSLTLLARAKAALGHHATAVVLGHEALTIFDQFDAYDAVELREWLRTWELAGDHSTGAADPQ
jgi:DNA-binding SARP family transcriptional activator